jgi:CrcB protein
MNGLILVFLGGGLGSLARYGISLLMPERIPGFPWRTFLANVISCLILGILIGFQMETGLTESKKLLLITGFCGGFSTFSAFSSEVYTLFLEHQFLLAFSYILSSLLISLLMVFLGVRIVFP